MSHTFAVLIDVDGAGAHPAAWRDAGDPRDLVTGAHTLRAVQAAERAGFTAVTLEDHPLGAAQAGGVTARIDAAVRASFAAPLTGAIGLVPVVHALANEPFHVAVRLATLDTVSLGRAGWIAVPDADPAIAARHGRAPVPVGEADAEFTEVVEVVRRLWDSWEDDAVIRDVATGRYLDRRRIHYADFTGRRFSVKGPSTIPRSPQGQLPIFAVAGTAAEIDVALVDAPLGEGQGELDAVAEAVATARSWHGDGVRVVVQLEVALDRAGRTAAERLEALDAHAAWPTTRRARYTGDAAGLEHLLVRLADLVDGVRILPAALHVDLDELGRAVLPALRARGLLVSPRPGTTLRDSFGLARPANRFLEAVR